MLEKIIGHDSIKDKLRKLKDFPPKVLLFSGPSNVGKSFTAFNFIDEIYDGYLNSKMHYHPDIIFLKPETKTFKLELVEKIHETLHTTPFELDKKFYILDGVDLMNKESANSCLKIFEDCPRYSYFILLADNENKVLDTIRSRSITFRFNPINNLEEYFPDLSPLSLKVMRGCIGNKNLYLNLDLDKIYSDVESFVLNFKNMTYSDIIEWFLDRKDIEPKLLVNIMTIACTEVLNNSDNANCYYVLESLNNFNEIQELNINENFHLKNFLVQARYKMSSAN
jgi:DNA polymerase III delta prime subunit